MTRNFLLGDNFKLQSLIHDRSLDYPSLYKNRKRYLGESPFRLTGPIQLRLVISSRLTRQLQL